jgi:hypothetical protein
MSSIYCTAFAGMIAPFAENALGKGGGCTPLVVKERVRNGTKRKGIEAFPLERNEAPTASVRGEGGTPPMKMERCQNKGVAGRAFCKHMKIKRMDGRNLGLAGMGGVPKIHSGCKSGISARTSFSIHGRG